MKKTKTPQTPQLQEPDTQSKRRLSLPKVAYSAFLCVMMSMIFCQPAYAATDVWTKAKEIMQDVYTQILAISTIAAIVTASVYQYCRFQSSLSSLDSLHFCIRLL